VPPLIPWDNEEFRVSIGHEAEVLTVAGPQGSRGSVLGEASLVERWREYQSRRAVAPAQMPLSLGNCHAELPAITSNNDALSHSFFMIRGGSPIQA
jgi:hypothetical protein